MTSTNYQHHRSQSQSRFPPPPSGAGAAVGGGGTHLLSPNPGAQAPPSSGFGTGTGGFSTLERSQRSKSLDNRRDFWAPSESASAYYGATATPPQSQPRAIYTSAYAGGASRAYQVPTAAPIQHSRQYSGSGFFNDTFSVPIQKVGASTLRNSQIAPPKHYRSAIEGLNSTSAVAAEQEDEEWQSFDRKVTYNHERTILPVVHSRRHHSTAAHYDDYGSRNAQHATGGRYAQDHDYNSQQQQQQQYYQQQNQQALTNFPSYYDDEYNLGGTYGRNGGNRAAGNHQHHESSAYYHRESAGGGGGAAHAQHAYQYENGYGGGGGHHGAYRHKSGYSSGAKSGKGGSNGWFGAHHYHNQHGALPIVAKPKRPVVHHKVHCCCFSFKWPPWGYEPCEPPTPMFYNTGTTSRRGVLVPPPPSIGAQTPRLSPRQPHSAAQPLHYGPADQLPPPPPPLVVGPGGAGGPSVAHSESIPLPPTGMDQQPHGRYSPPPLQQHHQSPPPPPPQQQAQHNRY